MFKVNYKDTRTTILTLLWCLEFEEVSHFVLVFPLLTNIISTEVAKANYLLKNLEEEAYFWITNVRRRQVSERK